MYKVKVTIESESVEFGFEKMSDAMQFASDCVETVDGMDNGKASVTIYVIND